MSILTKARLNEKEKEIITVIQAETTKHNIDNISRTKAYERFYLRNPEIKWAFLASMVSRNAGWNMCDLAGEWFPRVLRKEYRTLLFLTYERANWLIFDDAYPQLLLYEFSKQSHEPYFYLLPHLAVSSFMQSEWYDLWTLNETERVNTSLIINEQHVIQKPVIEQLYLKRFVFQSLPFRVQDWFHFNTVLFPMLTGKLYGFSVHGFRNVDQRIKLGRRLLWLLFHPELHDNFLQFSLKTEHTGSRYDYEHLLEHKRRETPFLRAAYPVVEHHRENLEDWSRQEKRFTKYYKPLSIQNQIQLNDWYEKKVRQLQIGVLIKEYFSK